MGRVLVVEPDPESAASLRDLLGGIRQCEVEVARSFAEGARRAHGESWDVVVSAERLGDGRGTDLLAALAAARPSVRRILMTAAEDPAVSVRAINEAHVDYFIGKPWDPMTFAAYVERLLLEAGSVRRMGSSAGRIPPAWSPAPGRWR